MSANLLQVNTDNFKQEVLDSGFPVLVDFGAEWCMPCRMIAPVMDELSEEYKGKIKFAKINIDNNTQLATELQILSIPLLILFKSGREITRMVGANPKESVKREIDQALNQ